MMTDKQKTEFKVGLTVFMAVIILIWVVGWAKNVSVFSDERELSISFDQVPGLEVGDIVSVRGVRSGKVSDISSAESSVLVKILIQPEIVLKTDAKFSIMMLDLMGGKKLEIDPGYNSEEINFEIVQNGYFLGDISTAMAMLSSVQSDLITLIKEVKITVTSINEIVGGGEIKEQIFTSLANLDNLTTSLSLVIKQNQLEIKNLIENGNELTKNANSLIDQNEQQLETILKDVETALLSSNLLLKKINQLVDETQAGENNLGKIMYDEDLLTEIKTNLAQLKELSKLVIDQMQKKGLKVDAYIF